MFFDPPNQSTVVLICLPIIGGNHVDEELNVRTKSIINQGNVQKGVFGPKSNI